MTFSTSISNLPYVGPAYQKKLEKLKIKTIGNLLFHFPLRYEDLSKKSSISSIGKGRHTVIGKIESISSGKTSRKRFTFSQITIQDSSSTIGVVWFNQPYLARVFQEGEKILVSGNVDYFNGSLQFVNPFYEKIKEESFLKIMPIYPETEGVSSKWLRFIIKSALQKIKPVETLPEKIIKENDLYSLSKALREIHFPSSLSSAKKAQERFSFERLFLLQLFVLRQKISLLEEKSIAIPVDLEKIQDLVSDLPFKLTDGQKKASWQILKDLEKNTPMNRLLEGDVGSGKTIVAVIASLAVIKAGHQVALMAPTEILAKQHFDEIAKLLWRFKIDIGLLTGKKDKLRSKKLKGDTVEISKEKLVERAKKGDINLLVGTHSLIQDKVKFKSLALVILDEQHRFGVEQRAKLCLKKDSGIPHLLSMTATPIPRTLALTLYGDLNLSIIREMPKERKKIITKLISPRKRDSAYRFIKKEIIAGRQVFFICPKIEESKSGKKTAWSDLKSVEDEKERLKKEIFPEFKIEMLHGKMKSTEKEKIMKDFRNKKIDILVSTSVIEVGIDIKNATVIVVEGAEMFGLSQLHQFRGRVGRGEFQSYCFLFTNSTSIKTKKRLYALLTSKDGFELAEKDLEIRGPGDFLGKRQWGSADFTMDALKDIDMIEKTREAAKSLLEKDSLLKTHPVLKRRVDSLKEKLHLE
jgi:ATP-dependent DNA helicase RecG